MTSALQDRRDHRRGTLYMVLVVMIWGGFLPVGKSALEMVDAYWLTAMRYGTAALVFIGLLLVQEGRAALRSEGQLWKIALFGACGFAGFGLCVFDLRHLKNMELLFPQIRIAAPESFLKEI